MRGYLRKSLSHKKQKKVQGAPPAPPVPLNKNKLNGLLAELAFRNEMGRLGFASQVSPGGWLARSTAFPGNSFGANTIALFPETVDLNTQYPAGRVSPVPQTFQSVAAHFHRIRIRPFYCRPVLTGSDPEGDLSWTVEDLSAAHRFPTGPLANAFKGFKARTRNFNFLSNNTDTTTIPVGGLAEEFSKEHLRISAQTLFMNEMSDIDAVFWGNGPVYPIEIKEKTPVTTDEKFGDWFGLDIGPFVKLSFYAAMDKTMQSLFVVHEIADTTSRAHVAWWIITFEQLAKAASWNKVEGGSNMLGGGSSVVRIPKSAFSQLDATYLNAL